MMAKKRPSLEALMQEARILSTNIPQSGIELAAVPYPVAGDRQSETPQIGKGIRRDKPHTTVYLDPAVRLAIKRIALDYNKKPHDLMIEGIDMMLIKYIGKKSKDIIT
jgi:hypothetical protein